MKNLFSFWWLAVLLNLVSFETHGGGNQRIESGPVFEVRANHASLVSNLAGSIVVKSVRLGIPLAMHLAFPTAQKTEEVVFSQGALFIKDCLSGRNISIFGQVVREEADKKRTEYSGSNQPPRRYVTRLQFVLIECGSVLFSLLVLLLVFPDMRANLLGLIRPNRH